MKEIKFRAWHKEKEMLVDVLEIYFKEKRVRLPIESEKSDDYWWYETDWDFDEVVLMQFTGLKDKNGVGIYDRDIVQVEEKIVISGKMTSIKVNKVVKYKEDYAQFLLYANEDGEHLTFATFGEVIGNVYDNPELIK